MQSTNEKVENFNGGIENIGTVEIVVKIWSSFGILVHKPIDPVTVFNCSLTHISSCALGMSQVIWYQVIQHVEMVFCLLGYW